jgi:uncharacterized protein (TIGR03089 family)
VRDVTPEQLFADLYRTEPSRPFVTYYDEATGERTELSVKSLANWVAKTHFLLTDELGLGVGDTALLAVPSHWIAYPIVLGCLTAGLTLTFGDDPAGAAVAFTAPATVAAAAGVADVYVIAPERAAFGTPGDPPAGALDYVAAVRPQPDAWADVRLVATGDDMLFADADRTKALAVAVERGARAGIGRGARLLRRAGDLDAAAVIDDLMLPLVVGGSAVLMRNCPDDGTLARRVEQERVTDVL